MNKQIIIFFILVHFYSSKNVLAMESNNPNNHQEATRRPTITNNNAIRSEQIDRSNKSTPAEELYPHYTFLLGMASLVGDICDLYEPCDACHKMIYDRWFNKPKPE